MSAPLLNLPSSACFAEVTPELRRVVGQGSSSFTLEGTDFLWPGEQWAFNLTMPVITDQDIADEWIAFGLLMKGTYGRVLMGDPERKVPRGVATGTPLVNGLQQAQSETLTTKGWSPNVTNILKRGDYLQLGSGSTARLHKVTANVNSDAGGLANIPLVPALRTSYNDGAAIVVNNPVGKFKLTKNGWSWRVTPGKNYYLTFDVVEALP